MALIKCPECSQELSDKAALCVRCGFPLAQKTSSAIRQNGLNPSPAKKWYKSRKWLLLVFFVIGMIGVALDDQTEKPTLSPQEIAEKKLVGDSLEARTNAKMFVENTLKAPTTAKWPNIFEYGVAQKTDKKGNLIKDVWEVSGYVDAQNSFGAMIRTQWYVKLKKDGKSWILLDIRSE